MAKSKSTSTPAVKAPEKPKANLKVSLDLAVGHLAQEIGNLQSVEQLGAIDEGNLTVQAMSYGINAVLAKLEGVHDHFIEIIELIKSAPVEKGGAQ
jgi:hypothetical protein